MEQPAKPNVRKILDTTVAGGDRDSFLYGGNGSDRIEGEAGDDAVVGGGGDDLDLGGEQGDDRIYDRIYGGSGADSDFYGGSLEGKDTIHGDSGHGVLATIPPTAVTGMTGRVGGSGTDYLYAGIGSDRPNGGSGVDTASGRRANDTCIVDTAADVVRETAMGGAEDVIRSDANACTLTGGSDGHVERANINETAGAASLVGNSRANTLVGNGAGNILIGNSDDDILNGRSAGDIAEGGLGDDTFVVDTSSDVVQDLSGEGTDLVRAETDYTLPDGAATAFIENLRLQGTFGDINGDPLGSGGSGRPGHPRLRRRAGERRQRRGQAGVLQRSGSWQL